MKKLLTFILLASCFFMKCTIRSADNDKASFTTIEHVNKFIGTTRKGNIVPVVAVPFGMVQLGPDTRLWGSGYNYNDTTLLGFSHTHKSGGGCGDFKDILFMPMVGTPRIEPGNEGEPQSGYHSRISHHEELSSPGFYQIRLQDYDITASLTATARCGFHRYEFPESDDAHIIIDLWRGDMRGACTIVSEDGYDTTTAAQIKIIDQKRIEGYRISDGWNDEMHVYFAAEFSKPFLSHGIGENYRLTQKQDSSGHYHLQAHFDFATEAGENILVKVGISPVSTQNAWDNLRNEIPGWDFEKAKTDNYNLWKNLLYKFQVEGGSQKQKELFYTGLHYTFLYPMLMMDINGQYRGPDYQVHTAMGYNHYAGFFSAWDVFRTANPLLTLTSSEVANDHVRTMLSHYNIYGLLPQFLVWGHEPFTMQGFHSVPMIADTYYKGIRNYDADAVYEAIINTAQSDSFPGLDMGRFVGLKNYKKYGYIPYELEYESVAKTLEFAYDDYAVAQMARMMGKEEEYAFYLNRANSYRHLVDSNRLFIRAKNLNGNWKVPFNPYASSHRLDEYMEGNAWQWTFYVPHDPIGLAEALGGKNKMLKMLDSLFVVDEQLEGENASPSNDIDGFIGQYAHGNEPSHHIIYFYNYLGQPWKTQRLIRQVMEIMYDNKPLGFQGNEDAGQMSAWYVMNALGFYPVSHGNGVYVIGSPLFNKIIFKHTFGGTLKVLAPENSPENVYVQSVKLNGEQYYKSWFQHDELFNENDVTIEFEMGSTPNKNWGSGENDRPPSMVDELNALRSN